VDDRHRHHPVQLVNALHGTFRFRVSCRRAPSSGLQWPDRPQDPLTVWVGTGENNSQRSVSYGDGVYKSVDGGRSWDHVGLKDSMHIGRIVVDPRDSASVYVAAMGPLWSPGGDRGVYKTLDGGKSWKRVLTISEHTGVSDLVMDPRNPDVLYAAA
jgi:photosystem II stability/assembly factor-like uncharacterized protein